MILFDFVQKTLKKHYEMTYLKLVGPVEVIFWVEKTAHNK